MVEIGAGTNFVIDEFLKTRAGENVISLLTPIISILDEESSSTLMSDLFDYMKTPLENIPGTGQLRTIRSIALPIARKLGFAERLAEIHRWLNSDRFHFRPQYDQVDLPLSDAIPASEVAVAVITALKGLMMGSHKASRRLVFCGIRGAAWVLVYASLVLGLGVCVVDKEGMPIPVTQPYSSAEVLIIPSKPDEVKLQTLITSSDQLIEKPQHSGNTLGMNWLVTCGPEGCNILSLLCGCELTDHSLLGSLIFTIVLRFIRALELLPVLGNLGSLPEANVLGKAPSYRWCDMETTELISHRVRLILHRFGIAGSIDTLDNTLSECIEKRDEASEGEYVWITEGLFRRLESLDTHHSSLKVPESWVDPESEEYRPSRARWTKIIRTISYVTAVLTHSDWAEGHSKLCYETLERIALGPDPRVLNSSEHYGVVRDSRNWFFRVYYVATQTDAELLNCNQSRDAVYQLRRTRFLQPLYDLLMGSQPAPWIERTKSEPVIGIELDGILLIDTYMSEPSLRPRPRYQVRQGQFSLDQERRLIIKPEVFRRDEHCRVGAITTSTSTNTTEGIDLSSKTSAAFSSSRVDILATLDLDAIVLDFYLYAKGREISLNGLKIDPVKVCASRRRTVVGLPCGHDVLAAAAAMNSQNPDEDNAMAILNSAVGCLDEFGSGRTFLDAFGEKWLIHSTIPFTHSDIWSCRGYRGLIAPTVGSPACQWATLSRRDDENHQRKGLGSDAARFVVQGQRCLDCILKDAASVLAQKFTWFPHDFTVVLGDGITSS